MTRIRLRLRADPPDFERCREVFRVYRHRRPNNPDHTLPTTVGPSNAPSVDSNHANAPASIRQTKTYSPLPSRSNHRLHPQSRSTQTCSTRDSQSPPLRGTHASTSLHTTSYSASWPESPIAPSLQANESSPRVRACLTSRSPAVPWPASPLPSIHHQGIR